MGLSASVKALALYWMQSMVRFSFPLFFMARFPPGATGRYTDNGSFEDREDFAVNLVQAFTLDNDIKLLMCLVRVEETAVLAGNERLEA